METKLLSNSENDLNIAAEIIRSEELLFSRPKQYTGWALTRKFLMQ